MKQPPRPASYSRARPNPDRFPLPVPRRCKIAPVSRGRASSVACSLRRKNERDARFTSSVSPRTGETAQGAGRQSNIRSVWARHSTLAARNGSKFFTHRRSCGPFRSKPSSRLWSSTYQHTGLLPEFWTVCARPYMSQNNKKNPAGARTAKGDLRKTPEPLPCACSAFRRAPLKLRSNRHSAGRPSAITPTSEAIPRSFARSWTHEICCSAVAPASASLPEARRPIHTRTTCRSERGEASPARRACSAALQGGIFET